MTEAEGRSSPSLQVAIDLNAVPPAGLGGIGAMDKGFVRNQVIASLKAVGLRNKARLLKLAAAA